MITIIMIVRQVTPPELQHHDAEAGLGQVGRRDQAFSKSNSNLIIIIIVIVIIMINPIILIQLIQLFIIMVHFEGS